MTGKFAKCSDEMVSVSIIEGHVWYALKRVLYVLDAIQVDFEKKTINLDSVRRKKIKQLEAESNVLKSERIRQYESYAEGIITKEKLAHTVWASFFNQNFTALPHSAPPRPRQSARWLRTRFRPCWRR